MSTGRLWDYLGDRSNPFTVYDYTPDRSADGPGRILADFRAGFLQADAYAGYDQLFARGIIEVGCMAHARRKFDEAKTTDPARAHAAMAYIGRLYQIEREAKERIDEAIERLAKEGPLDAAQRRLREWRLADEITHQAPPRAIQAGGGEVRRVAQDGRGPGPAQEPDRPGDLLREDALDGADAVPGPRLPGDRQQCGGAVAAADRRGSEELAAFRQRPGRPDRGGADELGGELPSLRRGAVRLHPRRAGPGEHPPGQPDRRAPARRQAGGAGMAEAAILALGKSRLPEAFDLLKSAWGRGSLAPARDEILLALAMLRLPAATDFLLELVADEPEATSIRALSALLIHRHDPRLRERLEAAVRKHGGRGLLARFEREFPRGE